MVRGWNAAAGLAPGLPMPTVRAAIDSAIAHHEARAYYETLDLMRFSRIGRAFDPGWPLYARSFLMRGYRYEQVGEREKADQAYTKFLDLWRDVAHPALEPQLRAAREGRVRVRDAAATLPLGPKARE